MQENLYRMRHKKQPSKKTYVSRERYDLNYSNLQHLLLRYIAWDSENFIHILSQKQKLQRSKLKSAILQLNTRYYRNCYTENANKINSMEFIWKNESSLHYSTGLSRMGCDTQVVAMLPTVADRHLRNWRTVCKRSALAWLKAQINSARGSSHAKSSYWIFWTCCLNWCY